MRNPIALALLPSLLGVVIAAVAFLAPFGNTGVDGTLGAGLALVGSVAATMLIAIIVPRRLPRGWFNTLGILAMLAAVLTAVAGYFLMQTLLAAAMAATLVLVFAALTVGRRTR